VYGGLVNFIKEKYWEYEYDEVVTPNIYNFDLWKTSGHAAHYKENMFSFNVEKEEFGLKPMNCPGHCVMFGNRKRSFRELPMRLADFGVLHRNEFSGALHGLTRVRRFQQDDAHIFCRPDQMEHELKQFLKLLDEVYEVFGLTYEMKLSTRPEGYLGEIEIWDQAEAALTKALNETGKEWKLNPGDGAFYGPKIDITVFDALKRRFQCATVQLDFQLPIRFNLSYVTEANEPARPIIIHRAILGSVERMFAILTEHFAGKWPFWLSPRQVMLVPISENSRGYALEVRQKLRREGFHAQVDETDRKMQKKVREAQLEQWNYILVVGDGEQTNGTVNIRTRDNVVHGEHTLADLVQVLKEERRVKSLTCMFGVEKSAAAAAEKAAEEAAAKQAAEAAAAAQA
jgi:threonyl-tRNA synthetase